MLKRYNKLIIIIIFSIIIIAIFSYKYLIMPKEHRIEISTLSNIEVFKFNSFSKFSNEKMYTINDSNKLIKFKTLFNNLDKSKDIKKISIPESENLNAFKFSAHIKLNFNYVNKDSQITEGAFLMYILVDNLEGKSYMTFLGQDSSYILDSNETNILREIFMNSEIN